MGDSEPRKVCRESSSKKMNRFSLAENVIEEVYCPMTGMQKRKLIRKKRNLLKRKVDVWDRIPNTVKTMFDGKNQR